MSPEKRSALMSRIRGRDTGPERVLARFLKRSRIKWETHAADLPGRPDFVFRRDMIAVFVDGDFWHGWRFPTWQYKLTAFWATKIAANRARDRRVHARLRRLGWTVVRIWEHDIRSEPEKSAERVVAAIRRARTPVA